jgi:oligopeptide/dipeptide ABC transporter ATP-binding protein
VSTAGPILQVDDLHKHFPVGQGLLASLSRRSRKLVRAVDGVSFSVDRGEILALVGESGSGKTTVGLNVLGLQRPTHGRITFEGHNVIAWSRGQESFPSEAAGKGDGLSPSEQIRLLRRRAQMVFQDPYEALNPRQTIYDIIAEPLEIHHMAASKQDKEGRIRTALETCGLTPADHFWDRYPAGLSGGQRQRVVIAGALVLEPYLLVADEPVSMLDVSIRAEILNLLRALRTERQITILYTTHDLATAGFFTDRMAVMYLGRIVEIGPTHQVLTEPQHPYTRSLLSVVPVPNPRRRRQRVILQGEIPNPIDIPRGCRFHPRCPEVLPECLEVDPQLQQAGKAHAAACIRQRGYDVSVPTQATARPA